MKAKDLRIKTIAELEQTLTGLRRQQFKTRLVKASGELGPTQGIKQARRNVARVKTILAEQAREKQRVALHG